MARRVASLFWQGVNFVFVTFEVIGYVDSIVIHAIQLMEGPSAFLSQSEGWALPLGIFEPQFYEKNN